jgi:hypothetical protein
LKQAAVGPPRRLDVAAIGLLPGRVRFDGRGIDMDAPLGGTAFGAGSGKDQIVPVLLEVSNERIRRQLLRKRLPQALFVRFAAASRQAERGDHECDKQDSVSSIAFLKHLDEVYRFERLFDQMRGGLA